MSRACFGQWADILAASMPAGARSMKALVDAPTSIDEIL